MAHTEHVHIVYTLHVMCSNRKNHSNYWSSLDCFFSTSREYQLAALLILLVHAWQPVFSCCSYSFGEHVPPVPITTSTVTMKGGHAISQEM